METIQFFAEGEVEKEYAIGRVTMNKVSDRFARKDQQGELKTYFVTFHDGARTRLHYHDTDQILIAYDDEGFVEIVRRIDGSHEKGYSLEVEDYTEFKKGETVLVPAGKLHWHGAKKGSPGKFSHIAILKNSKTVWL
jgi:quercetin dioxygenase-like cupin family protein